MSIIDAIVLGIVQGLTEFLPISSSGHLVLVQHFLGVEGPRLLFDVLLHVATLGAILVVYRRWIGRLIGAAWRGATSADLYRRPIATVRTSEELTEIWYLALGSLPAAIVGIRFAHGLEATFGEPRTVAWLLIVTGLLLLVPVAKWQGRRPEGQMSVPRALAVGSAQAVALLPGISRSGATISTALVSGVAPQRAARFSFLLSIPAILGAALVKFTEAGPANGMTWPVGVAGALAAFLVGWLALRVVLRTLEAGRFWMFSGYCIALGAAVLLIL